MATRSKYTIGRPIQDVRLRNWPAGKVAQLKRAVELMETELNNTMAAQVNQGTARVFSTKVPKVTGLSVKAGFKNFLITFNAAKGIQDLLFYEIQKDSTPKFANPTTFTIPQTTLTIPTTTEHESVYFRVRVINSKFEVGPWSVTTHATGSSNFRITVTRQDAQEVAITWANRDTWVDVAAATYTPTAASMCINIHAGVYTKDTDSKLTLVANGHSWVTRNTNRVIFRILRNDVELTSCGQFQMYGTAFYQIHALSDGAAHDEVRTEEVEVGTIITPFETFSGNEDTVTFILQAKLSTDNSVFFGDESRRFASGDATVVNDDAVIVVDAFDILEMVQSF